MDDDDSLDNENEHDADDERQDSSFKSFHLLNALSDLMMLPKDLLLSRSIRKEVRTRFLLALIVDLRYFAILVHIAVFHLFEGMPHLWCAIDKEGS